MSSSSRLLRDLCGLARKSHAPYAFTRLLQASVSLNRHTELARSEQLVVPDGRRVSTRGRFPAIEAKGELVEVVFKMLLSLRALLIPTMNYLITDSRIIKPSIGATTSPINHTPKMSRALSILKNVDFGMSMAQTFQA
jgi:hypothetical protein